MSEASQLRERLRALASALKAESSIHAESIHGTSEKRRLAKRIREVLIEVPTTMQVDDLLVLPAFRKNDRMEAPDGCMPNVDVRIIQYVMMDGTLSIRKSVDADNVPLSQISGVVFQGAVEIAVANSQLGGEPDV